MASRNKASTAVEARSSLAPTGLPGEDSGPAGGPTGELQKSGATVETHTGEHQAIRGHPASAGHPSLSTQTREGSGLTP